MGEHGSESVESFASDLYARTVSNIFASCNAKLQVDEDEDASPSEWSSQATISVYDIMTDSHMEPQQDPLKLPEVLVSVLRDSSCPWVAELYDNPNVFLG